MLIDIHTHTFPTSDDSTLTPEVLIDRSKILGLDGICLTDHDRFWHPDDIRELSKKHDYLIIPGCEVTTEEGHMLVYGLREYIFGMHRASFVKDLVEEEGGAMVIAHPYRRVYRKSSNSGSKAYRDMLDRAARNEALKIVDGIEVFNGRGTADENEFASDLSRDIGLPGTGASDAHKIEDIGTYATEFIADISNLEEFISEIKAGRIRGVPVPKSNPTR